MPRLIFRIFAIIATLVTVSCVQFPQAGGAGNQGIGAASSSSSTSGVTGQPGAEGQPQADAIRVEPKEPPSVPSAAIRPPEAVTATSGLERMVYLRWEPVTRGALRGYHIYRRDKARPGGVRIGTNNGRHATYYVDQKSFFNEVDYNTTYFYCVSSFGEDKSESACSNWISATTAPVPPVVEDVKAYSNAPRVIPITWRAASDSRVTGYVVFRSGLRDGDYREVGRASGRFSTGFIDGSRGSDLGSLDDLTTYHYRVVAIDRFGTFGQPSVPVQATTKPPPLQPVGVEAPSGGIRQARINWKKNTEIDVNKYRIWRSEVTAREPRPIGMTDKTEFIDVDLAPGSAYYYSVSAIDDDGLQSARSTPLETRTRPLPPVPSNLRATVEAAQGGQVRLEWNARGLEPNPKLTFIIQRQIPLFAGVGAWSELVSGVETLYYVDRSIEPGKSKTYRYRLIAVDYAGQQSAPGDPVEVVLK